MHRLSAIIVSLLALAALTAACSRAKELKECIYDGGDFEVYADSIVRGGKIYKALSATEITDVWSTAESDTTVPVYRSDQLMADALFAKAMSESGVYSSDDIYLSLGLLRPQESMEALRAMAAMPAPDDENFPYCAVDPLWAAAAWEVYCSTGSHQWLKEAYDRITSALNRQHTLNRTEESPLVCGAPRYTLNHEIYFPEWMDAMDRFSTISTSVNVCRSYSFEIASRMARELRKYAEREWQTQATRLRGIINDRLWLPDRQRYAQCLYGAYYPIVSMLSDSRANALAVLFDIATPEMGAAIVSELPLIRAGVPSVYPSITGANHISPLAQTLFGLAAARTRNPQAFNIAASALWNMALNSRLPAQWPAMVLRGIFGISQAPDGLRFSPMVPKEFSGDKEITGLKYRNATLDIRLHGTGDRIATFTIDSVSSADHFISADLSGRHRIVITLSGNDLQPGKVSMNDRPVPLPAVPKVQWNTSRDARILNFTKGNTYEIYVNGVMTEETASDIYHISDDGTAVADIVQTSDRRWAGFSPRAHVCAPSDAEITIHASSVTPRRPPLHFIRDKATATNYIELAARHNTRITCYANAPADGEYFLTVGYSNGSPRCALRTLSVNDDYAATLVFPPRRPLDWISVFPSTTALVRLKAGPNKIALTYIQGTILLNRISLLRK